MGRFQGDLPDRTYQFSLLILGLVDQLPNNPKGWEVGRQLLKSGTSIGANVREADQAISTAEFIAKCSIACKEASETNYWLQLCRGSGILSGSHLNSAVNESEELLRILITILRKSRDSTSH